MEGFYFFLVFAHDEDTFERLAMIEPPIVARGLRLGFRLGNPTLNHTRVALAAAVRELVSDTR